MRLSISEVLDEAVRHIAGDVEQLVFARNIEPIDDPDNTKELALCLIALSAGIVAQIIYEGDYVEDGD